MTNNRSHLSTTQVFRIGTLLKEGMELTLEGRAIRYKDGWYDMRIAKEVGVKHTQVARVRLQLFGTFPIRTKGPSHKPLGVQMAELEERISNLERLANFTADDDEEYGKPNRTTKRCYKDEEEE
jgi:hypothetical protein